MAFPKILRQKASEPARPNRRNRFRDQFVMRLAELESRLLMSADVPAGSDSPLGSIFWNGGPSTNPAAPPASFIKGITEAPVLKTITITNTSEITIFPILRNANTGQLPSNLNPNNPGNYYDPQDYHNQEYRAYVGYVDATGQHFGLKPGASMTFRVPLVFWDSARMYVATDGKDLVPDDIVNGSNPFRYDPTSTRGVSVSGTADSWVTQFTAGANESAGLMMFYHATRPQGIALDAPAQLTEFTIRAPYLTHWLTEEEVAETTVEYNYDVSYVDSLTAPISMEATDVPVPIPGNPTPPTIGYHYGWAGSDLSNGNTTTPGTMQYMIESFVKNQGIASIGQYFGTHGWPEYFNPNGILNIPSGANLFANSPLNAQKSSYFTYGPDNSWMLSSGGEGPVQSTAGGAIVDSQTLRCDFLTKAARDAFFDTLQGWKDQGLDFYAKNSTLTEFGQVTNFVKNEDPNLPGVVVTVKGPVTLTGGQSFIFYRPVTDYATTAITNLWYSWAKYYVDQFAGKTAPSNLPGSIAAKSSTIQLSKPAPASLAVGMSVTGAGLVPANGTSIIVLYISDDRKQIRVSQVSTSGGSGGYSFANPTPMAFSDTTGIMSVSITNAGSGYDPKNPPQVTFQGGGGSGATATAVVGDNGTITQIVMTASGTGYTSAPTVVISGNAQATAAVGSFAKTFPLTFTKDQQQTALAFAGSVYAAMFAESQIPQFTVNNPIMPAAMSLVYTTIGCDVTHIPNANDSNSQIEADVRDLIKSILRGVYDFTKVPEAQWYPHPATWQGGQQFNVYNLDPYVWFVHEVLGLSGYGFSVDDDTSDVGAYASNYTPQMERVNPNHLEIVFSGLGNLPNQKKWYGNAQYGMIQDIGTISNPTDSRLPYAGKTIVTLTDETKYWQIQPPGPSLIGAYVIGPGIPAGTIITEMESSRGLVLVLSNKAPGAKAVQIIVTGAPPVNPLSNSGFETPQLTQTPPGNFVLDPDGTLWDFNAKAGIAGNGSTYTAQNGPAPEGKQVALLGAAGGIRQKVTLQAGNYVLSFFAAQRKRGNSVDRQTISVLLDGEVIGTVVPSGPNYTGYTVRFTAPAGQHIIGLADIGATNDATALIDNVAIVARQQTQQPAALRTPPAAPAVAGSAQASAAKTALVRPAKLATLAPAANRAARIAAVRAKWAALRAARAHRLS
ncbi:DUF642 domain-containing protein [bacterium]|nr:DUF642 domain-containing protein [bacterium]